MTNNTLDTNPNNNAKSNETDETISTNDGSQRVDQIGTMALFNDGFSFNFEFGHHKIHAWGSAKSGKEKVFVDGQVVGEKRSFTRRSVIPFTIGNDELEIEFHTVSLLTAELHCSLIKNGVHVETQKQVPKYTADKKKSKWRIAFWFVIGFVFGFFAIDEILAFFS